MFLCGDPDRLRNLLAESLQSCGSAGDFRDPVMSGAWFRVPMWIIYTAVGIVFTMRYAQKIKKNPRLSVAYESDAQYREEFKKNGNEMPPFTLGHKLVLLTVAACMVWTIWGVVTQGYYIPEIASQFFVMGLVSGVIGVVFHLNEMRLNDIATSFEKGAADLLGAAMCVGMAQGIIIVLGGTSATEGTALNTILHVISEGCRVPAGAFRMVHVYIPGGI